MRPVLPGIQFSFSFLIFNIFLNIIFKLNDTTTAILSGANNPYSIKTFDWTTMLYRVQSAQFSKNRLYCGCGLLKINGQLLIAVSGKSWQMELLRAKM
jgi:hypothetical protein